MNSGNFIIWILFGMWGMWGLVQSGLGIWGYWGFVGLVISRFWIFNNFGMSRMWELVIFEFWNWGFFDFCDLNFAKIVFSWNKKKNGVLGMWDWVKLGFGNMVMWWILKYFTFWVLKISRCWEFWNWLYKHVTGFGNVGNKKILDVQYFWKLGMCYFVKLEFWHWRILGFGAFDYFLNPERLQFWNVAELGIGGNWNFLNSVFLESGNLGIFEILKIEHMWMPGMWESVEFDFILNWWFWEFGNFCNLETWGFFNF